jgi:D-alanine-D-alanine ligase-like ATP-grasp enzyme
MTKSESLNFATPFLLAAAAERGWDIVVHPDGGFSGQIRMPNGAARYFVRSTFDLNAAAATLVARDKALTKFYLTRLGYPVVPGRLFFADSSSRGRQAASRYSQRLGYPVIVKANSSAGGQGIEIVSDANGLNEALDRAFAVDHAAALVERYVSGMRDYRILVLDGKMLLAYERRPLSVIGDGRSTIRQLVSRLKRSRRAVRIDPEAVGRSLCRRGLTWKAVPSKSESVQLLDVANLSQGGMAFEMTLAVHPEIAMLAGAAANDLGLRYCGVDILTPDISARTSTLYVLELNAAPTIHGFVACCRPGRARLVRLYGRLLDSMAVSY